MILSLNLSSLPPWRTRLTLPVDDWPLPDHAYHLADAENWTSIRRTGLYCAQMLIARAGLGREEKSRHLGYRSCRVRLPDGVVIRDQRPMPRAALTRCLDPGLSPSAWYELVNSKVFFWLDGERLRRHVGACSAHPQIVLTVDLRSLLAKYGRRAYVTPFNVGNARRRGAARGYRTFVPFRAWLGSRWESEALPGRSARPRNHLPAELAIEKAVPDVMRFVVRVTPAPA